jgi:3-deoxy-D-manno-octulosonic-acid transferase
MNKLTVHEGFHTGGHNILLPLICTEDVIEGEVDVAANSDLQIDYSI